MNCLALSTRRAARSLTRMYEEQLRPAGMTPPQFGLLTLLLENPEATQSEIAEMLDLDQTTLSRNLRLLVEQKWVKRGSSREDKRQVLYAITAAGSQARARALPHWQAAQVTMQRRLGSSWETAFTLLRKLSAAAA